ncbi:hypothetical protein BX616_000104 [Lobosporangium transversale]|nr:hypothetical protein BX616_000104 [Lobosporangium transversale]
MFVDQSLDREDEALAALRELPRFEPLVVPEQPSHFSLANVFGSFSIYTDSSKNESAEMAFNHNTLVDMLIQMSSHHKKCAQDIQDYQRGLAQKMKALDHFTTSAVQGLASIHHQAKSHADQLLSVHAIEKQAETTTTLLHGILSKIVVISDYLPAEASGPANKPSPQKYPNLYRFLNQTPSHRTGDGKGQGWISPSSSTTKLTGGSTIDGSSGSISTPSGLALLGQHSHNPTPKTRKPVATTAVASMDGSSSMSSLSSTSTIIVPQHIRTSAPTIPKARPSMALASNSLTHLPIHAGTEVGAGGTLDSQQSQDEFPATGRSIEGSSNSSSSSASLTPSSFYPSSILSSSSPFRYMSRNKTVSSKQDSLLLRASDNLRRLANKSGSTDTHSITPTTLPPGNR